MLIPVYKELCKISLMSIIFLYDERVVGQRAKDLSNRDVRKGRDKTVQTYVAAVSLCDRAIIDHVR